MLSASINAESMPGFVAAAMEGCLHALRKAPAKPQIERLSEVQRRYADQIDALWRSTSGKARDEPPEAANAPAADPRFKSEEWRNEHYFDALRQAYLTGASYLRDLVGVVDADSRTQQQLQFATRQLIDAMSPANFLATNPEALALARETNGESVLAGLRNLVADLCNGNISTTDQSAFEVGRNLATAPGAVVFENELIQLIQYSPTTQSVEAEPLLIVPPCINRFYVLDLQPENSFVRYALDQGFMVFLISWRSAVAEIAHLTWDDYLTKGVFSAVEVVRAIRQVPQVHALGFCIGGTLLGCA